MQHPTLTVADGNPGVATGVADERNQKDLWINAGEHADALEAEPVIAVDVVRVPLRPVGKMAFRIPGAIEQLRVDRRLVFRPEAVDLGAGEVGKATRMVEVEVGAGDVADISRVEAEPADPLDRGLGGIARWPKGGRERDPESPVRMAEVVDPHPGVD